MNKIIENFLESIKEPKNNEEQKNEK